MKNMSSKKLASAVIISGLSLQLIPFNAFAASNLSNTTEMKTVTNVSSSNALSDTLISLRGKFINSNPIKANIRFDTEKEEILVDPGRTMPNPSSYRNNVYMTVQLFDKFGNLKNSFSLKDNDYPEINESIKKFNGQKFEYGDFLKIFHAEAGEKVIINGKVLGTQDDFSKGVSKDTLQHSLFKITENGLELVKDEAIAKVTGSCWTHNLENNKNGFIMKGFAGTSFETPKTSDNKQLLIKNSSKNFIKTINMESTNEYSKDKDDYSGFNVLITEDTFKQIPVGIYDLYVTFEQNGKTYEQPLKQDSIQSKDIHFEKDINKSDIMYFYPSSHTCLSYKFKTNDQGEVKLEVKLHNK